jgi:hypothetical protein
MGAKRGRGLGSQSQKPTTHGWEPRNSRLLFLTHVAGSSTWAERRRKERQEKGDGETRSAPAIIHTYEDDLIVASEVAVN